MNHFRVGLATLSLSLILLVSLTTPVLAQKKDNNKNSGEKFVHQEDEADLTYVPKGDMNERRNRNRGMAGSCSCRDLQDQVDTLELRLDRMIDLWNDFVDKNRNPYDEQYPRRPPQGGMGGGRGPYMNPNRPRTGRMQPRTGSRRYDDDFEQEQPAAGPRRFRF